MDIEDVTGFNENRNILKDFDLQILKDFIISIIQQNPHDNESYELANKIARRKYRINPKKSQIIHYFRQLISEGEINSNDQVERLMTKKLVRIMSGVEVITIFTSPKPEFTNKKTGERKQQSFSCGKNCAYCPKEEELTIRSIVTDISIGDHLIKISMKTDNTIDELRVITYVTKDDGTQLYCRNYKNFDDDKRTFDIFMTKKFGEQLQIGETVKCTKVEQSRSYISTEPGVRRANQSDYDAVLQFFDRASSLENCGHNIDKVELLVLGGTWSHYPIEYQEEFIRDTYYAANIFYNRKERERQSLENEININQTAKCRIIGLTLETRPDCINKYEIERFRKYNCTRVQIGVQHTDDKILTKINRGCYNKDTINAFQLLKKNCYKVDAHWMPDLPGSSYEKDLAMFNDILGVSNITYKTNIQLNQIIIFVIINIIILSLTNMYISIPTILISSHIIINYNKNYIIYELTHPELQADQWKIYPTEVTRWTQIFDWYKDGIYKPYAEEKNPDDKYNKLITLILHVKKNVFPWIRLNRVIRDIPESEIFGGNSCTNLRQHLHKILKDNGEICKCLRCREVKNRTIDTNNIKEVIRQYNDIDATEYFISMESYDESIVYGFCRLRINHNNNNVMKLIHDHALIRELHVYGVMTPHYSSKTTRTQHHGFGKTMLKRAEQIAYMDGIKKMAIISGIGVREYYKKRGYTLSNNFMVKDLTFLNNFCIN